MILYLFESYVNLYFDSIKGEEEIILKKTIFELSLNYLNKSLCFIDNVLNKKKIFIIIQDFYYMLLIQNAIQEDLSILLLMIQKFKKHVIQKKLLML